MKKVIIFLVIILASASTAEARYFRYLGPGVWYGFTHHPDWSNIGYEDYEIDDVPTDTVNIGTGTAYDTSLSDSGATSDFLAFLGIIGACLGLWFLYLEVVAPKRKHKTPKQAPVDASGYWAQARHDVTPARDNKPRFVYLAGNGGVMFI